MGSAQGRILKWTPMSRKLDSVKEKNLKWLERTILIRRQKTVGFQKKVLLLGMHCQEGVEGGETSACP